MRSVCPIATARRQPRRSRGSGRMTCSRRRRAKAVDLRAIPHSRRISGANARITGRRELFSADPVHAVVMRFLN
jgi:hypothetical protein